MGSTQMDGKGIGNREMLAKGTGMGQPEGYGEERRGEEEEEGGGEGCIYT